MSFDSRDQPQLVAEVPAGKLTHPLPGDQLEHALLVWERLAPVVPAGAVWSVLPARLTT